MSITLPKSTSDIYKKNGEYTKDRSKAHKLLILKKTQDMATSSNPLCVLFGGGSGSGKSTYLEELYSDKLSEAVFIDADEIKEHIPEYKEFLTNLNNDISVQAAFLVHTESSDISMDLIDHCIELNLSYIYVGTMSYEPTYTKRIQLMQEKGYTIEGIYIDVAIDVCLKRADIRAKETGREVLPRITTASNQNSAIVFLNLKPEFDKVLMFNNSKNAEQVELTPFYFRDTPFKGLFENGAVNNLEDLMKYIEKAQKDYIDY